jgi:hypothetical protein
MNRAKERIVKIGDNNFKILVLKMVGMIKHIRIWRRVWERKERNIWRPDSKVENCVRWYFWRKGRKERKKETMTIVLWAYVHVHSFCSGFERNDDRR